MSVCTSLFGCERSLAWTGRLRGLRPGLLVFAGSGLSKFLCLDSRTGEVVVRRPASGSPPGCMSGMLFEPAAFLRMWRSPRGLSAGGACDCESELKPGALRPKRRALLRHEPVLLRDSAWRLEANCTSELDCGCLPAPLSRKLSGCQHPVLGSFQRPLPYRPGHLSLVLLRGRSAWTGSGGRCSSARAARACWTGWRRSPIGCRPARSALRPSHCRRWALCAPRPLCMEEPPCMGVPHCKDSAVQ